MSQVSIIDIEGNNPQIPTQFDADIGFAIPIANVLNIYGSTAIPGVTPVFTVGSGNTITTNVQISQAIAAADATKVGLSNFNSAQFTVDANGFVSITAAPILTLTGNTGGAIPPDGAGNINILLDHTNILINGVGNTLTADFLDITFGNLLMGSTVAQTLNPLLAQNLTGFGSSALNNVISSRFCVGLGGGALQSLTTGFYNTMTGDSSGSNLIGSDSNSGFGYGSLNACVSGAGNTALGSLALTFALGSNNIAIGSNAGISYTGVEGSNINIAHVGVLGESNTIRVGTAGNQNSCFVSGITGVTVAGSAPVGVTSTGQLSSLGFGSAGQIFQSAGAATSPTWTTAAYPATTTINQLLYSSAANTVTGLASTNRSVLTTTSTGVPAWRAVTDGQIIIGSSSAQPIAANITGSTNISIANGSNSITVSLASSPSISGTYTTTAGNLALPTTTSTAGNITINTVRFLHNFGSLNTFVGANSGNYTTSGGGENTGIGSTALTAISTGVFNTAVGSRCMSAMQNGNSNTAMGLAAFNLNTSGTGNSAFGSNALEKNTGSGNTAVGYLSTNGIGNGSNNTAVGLSSGGSLTSGANNSILGTSALSGVTTGSNNIAIGQNAGQSCTGSDSNNIYLADSGTAGDNAKIKIGINGTHTTCFIQGISGVTVTGTAVLCAANGQLGTVASSERHKENVISMPDEISVMGLRPIEFNYKADLGKTKQYGLLAEDVDLNFPYLCFYNDKNQPESVKYHELPVLLLKEIQRLHQRILQLERKA